MAVLALNADPNSIPIPIAIIGTGCRFPGGCNGPEAYWEALKAGVDGITDVPADRWDLSRYYDPDPETGGTSNTGKGGFIEGIDQFDANFFNISPSVARQMDPQQRLLLEVTYEALEDGGIPLQMISGTDTCVFIGEFMDDWWKMQTSVDSLAGIDSHSAMGSFKTSLSARLSHFFNLHGPCSSVDTACSSSLVALHLACQSLRTGESKIGIAGGVNVMLSPSNTILLSKGHLLSPDGYCRSFDADGKGYVRSEGAGVVILKPLEDAERDGDRIYAVIRSTVVNSDGFTAEGITYPNGVSQQQMLEKACTMAGIPPEEVGYIEAHGTGTKAGDPVEAEALGRVFGKGRPVERPLLIGSVKSNLGHLEAGSGVAGLIKLALCLEKGQIPKNLHFKNPNPGIDFGGLRLKVPTALTEFPAVKRLRIGGVNSFGVGGTNAHAVLTNYVAEKPVSKPEAPLVRAGFDAELFILSARSESALTSLAKRYISHSWNSIHSARDISYSVLSRRSTFEFRLAVVSGSKGSFQEALEAYLSGEDHEGILSGISEKGLKPKVAFVCSGQGPQWHGMGRELMKKSSVFRASLAETDRVFERLSGWSLLSEMQKDESESRISETRIAQPAIMALQIGLIRLWRSFGVEPEGFVGHSIGEVAAAWGAGALSHEQAVEVIYNRSREQDSASGKGRMLAAGLSFIEAMQELAGKADRVSVAAVNGPSMVTFSGDESRLKEIAAGLEEREVFHRFLEVNVPFHSHYMEPLKGNLLESLKGLQPTKATVKLYSTVTGEEEDGTHLDNEYWYQNVREPVYFTYAIEEMLEDGFSDFVEISPHPILSGGIREMQREQGLAEVSITSLVRGKGEAEAFLKGVAGLSFRGVEIDYSPLFVGDEQSVSLPAYPWQHRRYWKESRRHKNCRLTPEKHPFVSLLGRSTEGGLQSCWKVEPDLRVERYFEDHRLGGTVLFPATGYIESAMFAGKFLLGERFKGLDDLKFDLPLIPQESGELPEIQLSVTSEEGDFVVSSREWDSNEGWIHHCRGRLNGYGDISGGGAPELDIVRKKEWAKVAVDEYYANLKEDGGLDYGPSFRMIKNLWVRETGESLSWIEVPVLLEHKLDRCVFHPALLDCLLHSLFAGKEKENFLPVGIEKVRIIGKPGIKMWSYVKLIKQTDLDLKGDIYMFNEEGEFVGEILGVVCRNINARQKEEELAGDDQIYEYFWEKSEQVNSEPVEEKESALPTILIVGSDAALIQRLAENLPGGSCGLIRCTEGSEFRQTGKREYEVSSSKEADFIRLFEAEKEAGGNIGKVVCLYGLESCIQPEMSGEEVMEELGKLSDSVLGLVKSLLHQDFQGELYLVTYGGDLGGGIAQQIQFGQGVIKGIGRVLVNEAPSIRVRMVDIGDEKKDPDFEQLGREILGRGLQLNQREVALRNGGRYHRQFRRTSSENAAEETMSKQEAQGGYFHAENSESGLLEQVRYRADYPRDLNSHEVLIEVRVSGLNFKDVLNGMGKLSGESVEGGVGEGQLGFECSGFVRGIGSEVTRFIEGDEVIAVVRNGLGGMVISAEDCTAKKPAHLTFEEAAAIPVNFITAYYSMTHLGRVRKGDRVLIHSATGGVGLAAIQLGMLFGAEIIATAGTEEKREYLRSLGIEQVFNSRSLSFGEEILEATSGEGVDFVLNSLTGEGLRQSFRCLAPFGRFIEIGKTDIYENSQLGLKGLGENILFQVLDVDRLMKQRPKLGNAVFQEVIELFEEKKLSAPPIQVYPASNLPEALGYLTKGLHIGKVVIKMEGEVLVKPAGQIQLKPDVSYLVTGGNSGIGLRIAAWMVEKGARYLVLLSRSGPKTAEDHEIIENLKVQGASLQIVKCDVGDQAAVARAVAGPDGFPTLTGVIHCAGILDDGMIRDQDTPRFLKVFGPKVQGAWNLHQATGEHSLDFFVCISSSSAYLGLAGQANYSAANNILNGFCQYRRSLGLEASAINFGVITEEISGMSKDSSDAFELWEDQGFKKLSARSVLSHLERLMLENPTQRMVATIDWEEYGKFHPHLFNDSRFKKFLNKKGFRRSQNGNRDFREEVKKEISRIVGVPPSLLPTDKSFIQLGFESLMLMRLQGRLKKEYGFTISLTMLRNGVNIDELANEIMQYFKNMDR